MGKYASAVAPAHSALCQLLSTIAHEPVSKGVGEGGRWYNVSNRELCTCTECKNSSVLRTYHFPVCCQQESIRDVEMRIIIIHPPTVPLSVVWLCCHSGNGSARERLLLVYFVFIYRFV